MLCVFLQVLLFLQKEKEESPPEAQVNEEEGENLKHCGHCQVLNGSNYTDPLSLISFQLPPHLFIPPHLIFLVTLYPPPSRSLFLVLSAPPATGELKECCSPTDSTTDFWFLYRRKINVPALQRGGLRKSKKAVTMKLEYRGVNMKKYCLKQLLYSRFHKERILFQQSAVDRGNRSSERNLLIRKLFYFFLFFLFFLWCVFWDQGKEEKVNYADVKSERHRKHFIYKNRIWRIFMFFVFFFFFFFVIESSVFEVKSLHWKLLFML